MFQTSCRCYSLFPAHVGLSPLHPLNPQRCDRWLWYSGNECSLKILPLGFSQHPSTDTPNITSRGSLYPLCTRHRILDYSATSRIHWRGNVITFKCSVLRRTNFCFMPINPLPPAYFYRWQGVWCTCHLYIQEPTITESMSVICGHRLLTPQKQGT